MGRHLALILLLAGCAARPAPTPTATPAPTPDEAAVCCAQCIEATRRDPSGQDLSLVPCGDYAGEQINGQPALTPACVQWFGAHPKLVQECR